MIYLRRIVLCVVFGVTTHQVGLAQAPSAEEADPRVACGPGGTYLAPPSPMIFQQPPPVEMVPLVPLPANASPRPGSLPGPMFGAPPAAPFLATPMPAAAPGGPLSYLAPGGAISPQFGLPAGPEVAPGFANPIVVPVTNDELAWEQITSVVSDYFPIARELQARRNSELASEGRIETAYQGGATYLEPHRDDSVGSFNRWESTFQTIRRSAVIRVIPDANGYLVEAIVQKELEDLPRPERATSGATVFSGDTSLPSDRSGSSLSRRGQVRRVPAGVRWVSLGRDPALEQRMLADIHARLSGVTTASSPSLFR